jgi:hypothetical protein
MTGIPEFNRAAFYKAAYKLAHQQVTVINPAILPLGLERREYMDICFAMLRAADEIYMLRGWENSKDATAELAYAKTLGIQISYE